MKQFSHLWEVYSDSSLLEGVFVALDKKARQVGMPAFNVMSKMGLIRNTAKDKAKAVFFSKLIIITALIPIFSFQKIILLTHILFQQHRRHYRHQCQRKDQSS